MSGRNRIGLGVLAVAVVLAGFLPVAPAEGRQGGPLSTLRVALIQSLFRDAPGPMMQALLQPFGNLMRSFVGLNGELTIAGDACELGRQLQEEKAHLGVFHGVEFAWAQQKFPALRPLVIAVNRQRHLYAYLVVRNDTKCGGFADLKGKTLGLPVRAREHCCLFVERYCKGCGQDLKGYFEKVHYSPSVEDTLDDLLRGKAVAAVVDGVSLACYQKVKPSCYSRLKVVQKSELFPAAVIAYRQGALDEGTLSRFRQGMIQANQTARGREMLLMWGLTAFEPVPADYQQTLVNIRRAYPAPFTEAGKTPAVDVGGD
jgi:ABC-type phosphate/phosphonate transport system substrate-binding protein